MDNEANSSFQSKRGGGLGVGSRRKHPYSLNLVHYLHYRETDYNRNACRLHSRIPPSHLQYEMPMFKCFTPNFTIQNVDKPHGFMRKFTPNGRLLLSFSQDQRSLDIYEYRGVGAMADLLQRQEKECVTASDHSNLSLLIRQAAFQRLFVFRRSLRINNLGMPGGYLNREFSIFIDDGRYVLVASMGVSIELPPVVDIFEYPDCFHDSELFFYTFYLVDLDRQIITDFFSYKFDSIQLSHNHGVSVFGPTMAIYSKYRQCIDLYEISNGWIHKTYTIGMHGAYLLMPNEIFTVDDVVVNSMPLTHLKQKILTFIYRRCISLNDVSMRRRELKAFYKDFPKYERMIISKMQLLDRNNLLIRYEQHPNTVDSNAEYGNEPDTHPFKLYVFYSIASQMIVNLYFKDSNELLYLLRDHCDFFRNVRSLQTGRSPSSSSNNIHLFSSFNDTVAMLSDPPLRLNPTLPISTQSFTSSPYLDYDLFLYDDRQISALERPRISLMESLCFRDRDTERPLFRLNLESAIEDGILFYNHGEDNVSTVLNRRELIAFIFHPYEPFVISLQKFFQRYVVNFHIYNKATAVKE